MTTFLRKYGLLLALPLLAALSIWLAVRIVASIDFRNNDFFTFWLAGHLAGQGGDPYSPSQWVSAHAQFGVTWIPNQAFVYPLPLSLMYVPLGWLPLKTAYTVWIGLSEWMIGLSLVLLIKSRAGRRFSAFFLPLLVGLIFFRPAILTLFNGQISGWILLLVALAAWCWSREQWLWGSLPLPLLMLKPNIGAPLLALLGLWLLFKRRYRPILVIAAGLLVLLSIGLLQDPHWVARYWSIGSLKVSQNFWGVPTLWGLGYLVCGKGLVCTQIFGGIASVLLMLAFFWFVLRRWTDIPLFSLVALACTVTLLVTPYIWTYDQLLLLLPIIDLTLYMARAGRRFNWAPMLFIGIDILIIVLLIFDTLLNVEIFNALIPLLFLSLYAGLPAFRKPAPTPVLNN